MAWHPAGSQWSYGSVLRERRLAAGLTQRELAEAGQTSVAAIRDLEQGRTHRPRAGLADRLVRALRLDPYQAADLIRAGRAPSWRPASPDAATGLRLRVLGPLAAWRDGAPLGLGGPRQRAVLALLATHHGLGINREAIIDAVWADRPPATAVSLVQAYVSRLRRVLDPGRSPRSADSLLTCGYGRYILHPSPEQLDLLAFGELADRAQVAAAAADLATACGLYERALMLWQGELLADVELIRRHPAILGLGHTRAAVVGRYAEAAFGAGRADRVLPHLRDLAGCDPLNETTHAQLIIALAATGQQAAALHAYAGIRERLDRQLGVRPGRELTDAHLRVLRQDIPAARIVLQHARAATDPADGRGRSWKAPRQLPAVVAPFTGRTAELRRLSRTTERAIASGRAAVTVIDGMPGIGKSTFALHWAQLAANRFPDGQLYVNLRAFDSADEPVTATAAVRGFLRALGVSEAGLPADLDSQASLYRSAVAGRRILVVVDDARDTTQVRPLLPGSPGCLALVTSRRRLAGLVADGAALITLDLLSDAQARTLLARRVGRVRAQQQAIEEIVGLCDGLPLALSLAAATAVSRPGIPLSTLAEELRHGPDPLSVLDIGDAATSLRRAFSASYRALGDRAAVVFRSLGTGSGRPVISDQEVATAVGISRAEAREALRELAASHLVTERTPGRFAIHDLLRAFATESPDADPVGGIEP